MTPAASCALVPRGIVQARASFGPAVKNEIRSSSSVAGHDHPVQTRLFQAKGMEVFDPVSGVEGGNLGLDRRRDHHGARAGRGGPGGDRGAEVVAVRRRSLIDVAHIENRLGAQQLQRAELRPLLRRQLERARWPPGLDRRQNPLDQ